MNRVEWEKYGLREADGRCIQDILARFAGVREAVLFGSRAKGNYKPGSDIDLALKGEVSKDALAQILMLFEESLLPYFVDVLLYDRLKNEALKEHIDRVGASIYKICQ